MGAKILIADDDQAIRDIFQIIFEKAGYILEIKENGEDLLDNKFSIPDVFLIDRQLSGISGLDVCRHLKSQLKTAHIPVIMVSASPDIGVLSKEAGADAFIEKPFDINSILELVNRYSSTAPRSIAGQHSN